MPAMAFDNASICRHFFVGMAHSYCIVATNLMAVTHGAPKLALAGIWIAVCQSKLWCSSLGSMHNIKLRQGKKKPAITRVWGRCWIAAEFNVAEREGFEPSVRD